MAGEEITHIGDLRPQQEGKNARKHTARNIGMIARSLEEVGAARSIVIDEDGEILAGNGTWEAAGQMGIERVRIIDADGDELIAVRRSNLTEKQKIQLALADNRAAELAGWDAGVLAEIAEHDRTTMDGLFTAGELGALLAKAGKEGQDQAKEEKPSGPTQGACCPQCGCQFEIELVMGKGKRKK